MFEYITEFCHKHTASQKSTPPITNLVAPRQLPAVSTRLQHSPVLQHNLLWSEYPHFEQTAHSNLPPVLQAIELCPAQPPRASILRTTPNHNKHLKSKLNERHEALLGRKFNLQATECQNVSRNKLHKGGTPRQNGGVRVSANNALGMRQGSSRSWAGG
jgi:hypothetical protein